jgi:DNA repair protein RadB
MGKISSGSYDLNKWLSGGYDSDIVTVVCGGPGTGKTNFCMMAAVSEARRGKKVIYMDTEGGFSVERVKQIEPARYEEVLKNILLLKPTSFYEQKKDFEKLEKYLKDEASLIIVDGMTILYRLEFAAARQKGEKEMQRINAILAEEMRMLAEIARKKNVCVLVTNQVYNWEDETKMVGGDVTRYWAKCLIELKNEQGRRVAYLRKHRYLPEKEFSFVIYNLGIKRKGWL